VSSRHAPWVGWFRVMLVLARRMQPHLAMSRSRTSEGRRRLGPGTILQGRYCLERLLAQGGLGAVFVAADLVSYQTVAVKVPLTRGVAPEQIAQRYRYEALTMAAVRHPNIVQVLDAGQDGDLPFQVMQYVPGKTVKALIHDSCERRRTLGLSVVSAILRQVAAGLDAMHEGGVVHGDVKPSNMIIDSELHVAICDFGLVRSVGAGGGTVPPPEVGVLGGTPLYVAPELLLGAELPPKQRYLRDSYSLGASLYEMLTGQPPFVGRTLDEIVRGPLLVPPPRGVDRRPDLPAAIDAVVVRALAKAPAQRYRSCEQLSLAVDQLEQLSRRRRAAHRSEERRRSLDRGGTMPYGIAERASELC